MNGRSGAKPEKGEETVSKHQIQPGVENEPVNAGGAANLSRKTKFSGANCKKAIPKCG